MPALLSSKGDTYNAVRPTRVSIDSKAKTILIVDDDEWMRDMLSAILKRDYRVHTAPTGEEGLNLLKREAIDLMLLDVRLPGINGLEVLKIARENYNLVEAIMVSAVNEVEVAVQAMKHGAYHYITKEFDYDGLRSLVRNAPQRQDLSRQVISLTAQPWAVSIEISSSMPSKRRHRVVRSRWQRKTRVTVFGSG